MSPSLFVSDLHIASAEDPKAKLLLELLGRAQKQNVKNLFLVGDIFDLWIADRKYFVETYQAVIDRIRALVQSGTHVYYFEGNHDLDLNKFWGEDVGVQVCESARYFDLDGKKVRVEHGDQMDPEDRGYLFLRWLLRTPVMRALGRNLPDATVKWIGSRASRASRDYTSQVKVSSEERTEKIFLEHAQRAYREQPYDYLISGHVHVVMDLVVPTENGSKARALNLGTWLKEPMLLELSAAGVKFLKVSDWMGQHG
ncbi:MAG: UDP-2,3-diacylglucosamine diphosphatase [Bdellovibrionales bacterium]